MYNTQSDNELFEHLLERRRDNIYWKIMSELRSRSNDFVFQKCMEWIASDYFKQKIIGIEVLSQLGIYERPYKNESISLFFNLLNTETDSELLESVLIAIGHNNDTLTYEQIKLLVSFKEHRSYKVRYGVVLSISGLTNTEAIEALLILSKDKKELVRDWATFGLGTQIDTDTVAIREALWERTQDIAPDIRIEAIYGLAKRGDVQVQKLIEKELDENPNNLLLIEAAEILKDSEFLS